MKSKKIWAIVIGVIVFVSVFSLVFSWKVKTPQPKSALELAAQQINEIGYVGGYMMACVDDNECPTSYDPQSALGLMPFVKLAEDEAFAALKIATQEATSLASVMEAVRLCQKYCSCPVWQRFLESEHGSDFDLSLAQSASEPPSCPRWSELSEAEAAEAEAALNLIESYQN